MGEMENGKLRATLAGREELCRDGVGGGKLQPLSSLVLHVSAYLILFVFFHLFTFVCDQIFLPCRDWK